MPRLAAVLPLLLSLAVPTPARPDPAAARPAGQIVSDEGRTEILGRPLRAGDTIELPEGFLRIEEDGPEDGEVGSFTVVSADAFREIGPAAVAPAAGTSAPAAGTSVAAAGPSVAGAGEPASTRRPAAPDCRAERGRYLAELWRLSGIEVASPDALIEGLEGADGGPRAGFFWFALATDPFRPLAWSSELRDRADALARCVRGE